MVVFVYISSVSDKIVLCLMIAEVVVIGKGFLNGVLFCWIIWFNKSGFSSERSYHSSSLF